MESSTEEWIVRNLLLCLATVGRDGTVAFFWLVHWEDAFGTRVSPQERLLHDASDEDVDAAPNPLLTDAGKTSWVLNGDLHCPDLVDRFFRQGGILAWATFDVSAKRIRLTNGVKDITSLYFK